MMLREKLSTKIWYIKQVDYRFKLAPCKITKLALRAPVSPLPLGLTKGERMYPRVSTSFPHIVFCPHFRCLKASEFNSVGMHLLAKRNKLCVKRNSSQVVKTSV